MRVSGQQAAGRARSAGAIRYDPPLHGERPVGALLARYRRYAAPRMPALSPDIAFLVRHGIPHRVLALSSRLAAQRGTEPRQELFAAGFDRQRYWAALAGELGLRFAADLSHAKLHARASVVTAEAVREANSLFVEIDGATVHVVAPERDQIAVLRAHLRDAPELAARILIAAPETIRAFLVERRHTALTHYAVNRLAHVQPRLSARLLGAGGAGGPATLVSVTLGLALLSPGMALIAFGFLFTLFFFNCSLWKLGAALSRPRRLRIEPLESADLPTYAVLVPLYREASVVPDLANHLAALDYPASKLQIVFVVEADDAESRAAIARHAVYPSMETVVVPPGGPRTKPKALTYALPFARGDYVVVFDAEDRPEPDQLRKAAAAFRERPYVGCVQARLATDNEESLLARLFKVEYAANFEVLLPALASWFMPLPLGGTSNHFPRAVLEQVGAWDPYNVTEDADLGVRLARFGYDSVTILSRTWEEAPVKFSQWLPQRRRWIKGWMRPVKM